MSYLLKAEKRQFEESNIEKLIKAINRKIEFLEKYSTGDRFDCIFENTEFSYNVEGQHVFFIHEAFINRKNLKYTNYAIGNHLIYNVKKDVTEILSQYSNIKHIDIFYNSSIKVYVEFDIVSKKSTKNEFPSTILITNQLNKLQLNLHATKSSIDNNGKSLLYDGIFDLSVRIVDKNPTMEFLTVGFYQGNYCIEEKTFKGESSQDYSKAIRTVLLNNCVVRGVEVNFEYRGAEKEIVDYQKYILYHTNTN